MGCPLLLPHDGLNCVDIRESVQTDVALQKAKRSGMGFNGVNLAFGANKLGREKGVNADVGPNIYKCVPGSQVFCQDLGVLFIAVAVAPDKSGDRTGVKSQSIPLV